MKNERLLHSVVPLTAGEAALASVTWRRVGIFDRLVRVEETATPAEHRREADASPAVRGLSLLGGSASPIREASGSGSGADQGHSG